MIGKLPRQALPLLLLYLDGGSEITGRTRFQKIMFIIEHEVPEIKKYFSESYEWSPYHYGPFSDKLLGDLAWLDYWEFIEIHDNSLDIDSESPSAIYRITDKGKKFVEEKILPVLPDELVRKLEKIKRKYRKMSLFDLIKYVYENYSSYTVRSRIREIVFS